MGKEEYLMLVRKLPSFNPAGSDKSRLKWFDLFSQVLIMGKKINSVHEKCWEDFSDTVC